MSTSPLDDAQRATSQRGPSRRRLLTGGAAAFAVAAIPGAAARAAQAAGQATRATTEPRSMPPEGRVLASLNGTWDFMPTTGAPTAPPATGPWDSIPVPAEWNMTAGNFATPWDAYDLFETPPEWDSVDVAWYRRTVDIPAAQRGSRIVVQFGAVNFEATVFFNGTRVTTHQGGLLPFEADVTDQVNWTGTNVIHVLVTSGTQAVVQSDGWHYPNGSWWGQTCWGIWQDVWLVARPQTYVSDSYVVTNVTNNQLTVSTTLTNGGTAASTVMVTHQVNGTPIRGTTQATVPAGGTTTVTFTRPWSNPRLWNQQDPYLYRLTVTAGEDIYTTRFGFREIVVSGTDILLNGEAITLRGDAWHFMGSIENSRAYATEWFSLVKQAGINYLRLHAMPYPPVFYDVADEMGMLIVGESGIYGSSGNYALSSSDFWANCDTHLTARIIRDRNHPSVFAWSAENEMLAAFGQGWASQVAALKQVAAAVDTTRPIYFEGDGDPNGAGDLESTHYPLEITTSNTAIPESAYALAPGQSDAGFWDRSKPMLISEFSSMYYATPAQVSAIGGPATYADLTGLLTAHELIVGAQIEGFRYAGATGVSPWNTVWYGMWQLPFEPARESLPVKSPDGPRLLQVGRYAATLNPGFQPDLPSWNPNPIHTSVARTMPATAALATDYRTHFWGGATLTRTYAVYSDQGPVTVEVELRLAGGRGVNQSQKAKPGTTVTFDLTVPTVSTVTPGTLTVRAGGYQHQAPLTAYPRSVAQRATSAALSALVYQNDGSTATSDALTSLGVTTTMVTDLSSLPAGNQILVLGEGSTVSPTAAETTALIDFISGGGMVLSLAQTELAQILPWTVLPGGSKATIAHVVAPHHPVLSGIGADDLRWWNTPSEIVLSQGMVKPRYGSLKSIADVGPGLATSALAEAAYGSGTCVLCQFPVIAAAADEPIAAILLRNMLDYLATRPVTPGQELGVVSPSGSGLAGTLTGAAVGYSPLTMVSADTLSGLGVLLVDASSSASVSAVTAGATALSDWVSAGGTLWVNGLSSATALGSVLPPDLMLTSLDSAHQHGAVTTGKSELVDGLNNADLDWPGASSPLVTATVSGAGGTSAVSSRAVDWSSLYNSGAEQTKYQEVAESARGFIPGSVVWTKPVGSGRLVIDMLNWPSSSALPAQTTLAAGIAAGLGIGFTASSGGTVMSTSGWTSFASPNNGDAPLAYDGNLSTRWSSNALQEPGMYYGVDLGGFYTLSKIVWDDSPAPGDLPRGLDIQTSSDGNSYTAVLSLTSDQVMSMTDSGVLTIPLSSVTTKYLKLVDTGSAPGNYMSLYELYLFGAAATAVADPLAGTAPVVIVAGRSGTVSATFTNNGNVPLPGVTLSVSAPDGWGASAVTPVSGQTVPAGGSVTATWTLTAPAEATAGGYTVSFTATSSSGTFTAQSQTAVPYASVADAYNNVGIVNNGETTTGSLDDQGNALSAQALAAAGFSSGSTVTVSGVDFTWPGTNVPDNIVCTGQAVGVAGSGSTLGIIGAGDNGTGSGTATVVYTDGSAVPFRLSLANWWDASPVSGTSIAVTTAYIDEGSPATQVAQTVALYYQAVAIDSSKTVAYVALPQVTSSDQIANQTALHVFAIGISG